MGVQSCVPIIKRKILPLSELIIFYLTNSGIVFPDAYSEFGELAQSDHTRLFTVPNMDLRSTNSLNCTKVKIYEFV